MNARNRVHALYLFFSGKEGIHLLEMFERGLVDGKDLERVRQDLLNQANADRLARVAEIEHDFKIATLVRECLLTEPKGSAGYAVSKGIMNRLNERYRDPVAESTIRKLRREARKENRDDNKKGKSSESSGTEQTAISRST